MSDTFILAEDDISPSASNDVDPLRCQHPGCDNAVVKPARGRTPKYCPEHKATNSRTGGGNKSSLSGKSWPRATEIEALLNQYVTYAGIGVAFLNKEDGAIVQRTAPQVVHELVELAKDDKNLRKWLEALATPGKYAPLTLAVMGMVIPILANHDLLPKISIPQFPDGGEN